MISKRSKWSYAIGCTGRDMCYTLVSMFLLIYIQYTNLVDKNQFLVLSAIIVLCRVWDAVNDPMMGTIISNTKTRLGKYRPWVLIGCLSNALFLILLFTLRFENGWVNVAVLGVTYLLWGMTFTMNDISYWDLLPALTSDKKERDNLTTMVAVFASVGAFASGGLVPILTPGNMVVAYRVISIIWAIVFVACQLLVFFGVHDNKHDAFMEPKEDVMGQVDDEKVTLKGMVKILFSNKQLLVMALVVLLYTTASSFITALGQNFLYFRYGFEGDRMFVLTVISSYALSIVTFPFSFSKAPWNAFK